MRVLIVYDTLFGNTEQIAGAIASGLDAGESVELKRATAMTGDELGPIDLLLVGGPTQKHRASPALRSFLDGLSRGALHGVGAAAFDTRYRMSRFLTGSAAVDASRMLKRAGADMVCEPESFFMERHQPPAGEKRRHQEEVLEPGEVDRARAWARRLIPARHEAV